jgi:hypothetical protein
MREHASATDSRAWIRGASCSSVPDCAGVRSSAVPRVYRESERRSVSPPSQRRARRSWRDHFAEVRGRLPTASDHDSKGLGQSTWRLERPGATSCSLEARNTAGNDETRILMLCWQAGREVEIEVLPEELDPRKDGSAGSSTRVSAGRQFESARGLHPGQQPAARQGASTQHVSARVARDGRATGIGAWFGRHTAERSDTRSHRRLGGGARSRPPGRASSGCRSRWAHGSTKNGGR